MERQIARAVRILKNGGVVAFPTDTLYGLGANAFDESAVLKIFAIKSRPRDMALTLLLADTAQIKVVGTNIPELAWKLAERYMPGALTIVIKKSAAVSDAVSGGRDTVAVRVPDHPVALALIRSLGAPLTGTSANLSGTPDPATAQEVHKQLGAKVDMIIDGGRCPAGVASTIIDLTADPPTILRKGVIKQGELERTCKCRIALKEDIMRIAIGCDHRGRALKKTIKGMLAEAGHECADMGTHRAKSVDYPDIAAKVAAQVTKGKADRGILICGTGIGMCISANKIPGIRAANCNDLFSVRRSREHNDANVLCVGSDMLGEGLALDIVKTFLSTKFAGERHQRRLDKISALEQKRIR